jgi:hypothetical protein
MDRNLFFLVFLLCGAVTTSSWFGQDDDKATKESCDITASERCHLSAMRQPTEVFPGGETRCMSAFHPKFSFSVFPGDPQRLLIYLEGGGACVDPVTAMMRACDEAVSVKVAKKEGIFDRSKAANPYRNFTIVYVNYCSGDLFVADIKQKFGYQYGLLNTQSALDWAKANHLERTLHTFILAGSSAGSLGVQLWARSLLSSFSYERAAVIADSFVCVMPPGAQGMLFRTYQVCDNGLFSEADQVWCRAGNLTVQHLFASAIASFPEVTFVSINSKEDFEQIKYYNMLSKIFKGQPPTIDGTSFYKMANSDLSVFSQYPNFVSFWLNSQQHMYLNMESLYDVDATGTSGDGSGPKLIHWLRSLPVRTGESVSSQCSGKLVPAIVRRLQAQACNDPDFPYQLLKSVAGAEIAICFSKQEYASQKFGPCESWCVTDARVGDGCNGCCGDINSKICGSVSASAVFDTDSCDSGQAGKVFRIVATTTTGVSLFRIQNESTTEPDKLTLGEKILKYSAGFRTILFFALVFVGISCCCLAGLCCYKDRDDYDDDISEKSGSSRQPSLVSAMSQYSDDEDGALTA